MTEAQGAGQRRTTPSGSALDRLAEVAAGGSAAAASSPLLAGFGGGSGDKYYGVPDDYRVPADRFSPRAPSTGPISPRAVDWNPSLGSQSKLPLYESGTALNLLRSLSDRDIAAMQRDLRAVGIIGPQTRVRLGDFTDPVTQKGFEELLGVANMMGTDFATAIQTLRSKPLGLYDEEGNFIGGGGGGGSRTQTSTSTTINLTDPTTARAVLRQALEDRLGRGPKEEEFQTFLSTLNNFERKNPRKETATTTVDAEGNSSTTRTLSGSEVTPAAAADEFTRQGELGEEANTFMVANDYYNAALQAIQSPGG